MTKKCLHKYPAVHFSVGVLPLSCPLQVVSVYDGSCSTNFWSGSLSVLEHLQLSLLELHPRVRSYFRCLLAIIECNHNVFLLFCKFGYLSPTFLRANPGVGHHWLKLQWEVLAPHPRGLLKIAEWIWLSTTHYAKPVHPLFGLMVSTHPLSQKHLYLRLLAMFNIFVDTHLWPFLQALFSKLSFES